MPRSSGPRIPKQKFRHSGPGGLLVPHRFVSNSNKKDEYPFIGVSIGYTDLFSDRATLDDVIDRLKPYGVKRVLDVTSRVSAVLYHFGFPRQVEAQRVIRDILFGPRAKEINDAIKAWHEKQSGPSAPFFLLFHELQLANTAKIALLALPDDGDPDQPLDKLGEALLMVTDLINKDEDEILSGSQLDQIERLHKLIVRSTLFNAGDERSHAFARAFDIFLSDKAHLRHHDTYLNLPETFERIVGLPVDLYWTLLFATYSHFARIEKNDPATAQGPIDVTSYFSKVVGLSDDQLGRFLLQVANTVSDHRATLTQIGCTTEWLNPYELLSLEIRPLVSIDENVYCSLVQLLEKKLVIGLHYVFLNGTPSKEERDKYLTYLGHVFSDYIKRIFDRAYPESTRRYISDNDLKKYTTEEVCDGALVCPEALILIECKATLMTHEIRVSGTGPAYETRLERIFVKAARQIDATIRAVKAGKYISLGLDPKRIKKYYPVVAPLENLPYNPLLADQIQNGLKKANLLQASDIGALQPMSIDELEYVEVASQQGKTLQQLIDGKLDSAQYRDNSFRNQWIANQESFLRTRNPYLAKIFDDLFRDLIPKYFSNS